MIQTDPVSVLQKYFGYNNFRDNQLEIINAIISGLNVLAVMPTGAGKSLCYQIPALVSEKYSIVVSPLIALMKNQIDELKNFNIGAESIHSNTDINLYYSIKERIETSKIKLLYVSPERLTNFYFIDLVRELKPEYLFVDEAHCISQWGHNFRPSYRKINNFCKALGIKKISAFTATAIPEVIADIKTQLGFTEPKIFINGFERNNLSINVEMTNDKKSKLLKILQLEGPTSSTIIYSSTRKTCEEVSAFLNLNKIPTAFYHAGMPQQRRETVQQDFLSNKIKVISATNAFGMGINKSDVRKVIHFNAPATIESYYQEIGRAGRDGKNAAVYMLYESYDIKIQERLLRSTFPAEDEIKTIYNMLNNKAKIALGSKSEKSIKITSDFLDILKSKKISEQKFYAALDYFEQLNILSRENNPYLKYYAKINCSKDKFSSFIKDIIIEVRDYLIYLAKYYHTSIFDNMTEINIENMASFFETTINKAKMNLEKLNSFGLINYESPQSMIQFRFNIPRFDPEKYDIFQRHENKHLINSINKLKKMQEFVETKDCRFRFILEYFGQESKDYRCGKCDNCTNRNNNQDDVEYVSEIIIESLKALNQSIDKGDLISALIGEDERIDLWNIKNFSALKFYKKAQLEEVIEMLKVRGLVAERKSQLKLKSIIVKEEKEKFDERMILFNKLKEIRHLAASKFFQPEQLICSDEILLQITNLLPKTYSELLSINGFSQRMYNKIGEEFLKAVKGFADNLASKIHLPKELEKTFDLVNKNYSLKEISEILKISESIISIQIETILQFYPNLKISSLIPQSHLDMIKKAINDGYTNLKSIKEFLGERITYAEIRIVKAKLKAN